MKFYVKNDVLTTDDKWPTTVLGAKIASIQKWFNVRKLKPLSPGGRDTCALCKMFYTSPLNSYTECTDCPILKITGKSTCNGTPHYKACRQLIRDPGTYYIDREIRFLISLLPGLGWLRRGMKQEDDNYA